MQELGLRFGPRKVSNEVHHSRQLLKGFITVLNVQGEIHPVFVAGRFIAAPLFAHPVHKPPEHRADHRSERDGDQNLTVGTRVGPPKMYRSLLHTACHPFLRG
ncbi:MAG: hypothetical protein CL462_01050 [Acidimicrobiaceae bacterium]|nr:hypothetical protein [Acidimicrobiaceae bacterium]